MDGLRGCMARHGERMSSTMLGRCCVDASLFMLSMFVHAGEIIRVVREVRYR